MEMRLGNAMNQGCCGNRKGTTHAIGAKAAACVAGILACAIMLSSCDLFPRNDPTDPGGANYQGYDQVQNMDDIKTFTPAAGVTIYAEPSLFIVSDVIGADAYHLQISFTPGFESPLVLDKADFSSNKMSPGSADLSLDGTYYWRARSNQSGIWGVWTTISSFALQHRYIVTYDGNDNTGGSIPVDSATYLPGATVTVLGNTGTLTKEGNIFDGWNTEAAGTGTNHAVASTFTMGSANVVLYAKWRDYIIGDTGPAEGLVSYDKGSYSSGWRYLEVAPSDQSTGIQWFNGSYVTTGATATGIGSGKANTATIVSAQGAGRYAASLCANLVLGGYDDWFLPSRDELDLIYHNLKATGRGGFASAWYWSSTENSSNGASGQLFSTGPQLNSDKDDYLYVRAVRAF
jgi:uncharacterized repeat protein (TIGR02543 family)